MPADRMTALADRGVRLPRNGGPPSLSASWPARASCGHGVHLLCAVVACGSFCWCGQSPALAAPDTPPAPTSSPGSGGFQSQDISIGEPISLPFAAPLPASPQPPSAPAFPRAAAAPAASTGAVAAEVAGTGWLGLAVDDALVTGRLVVVEVAPDGPAARAGVRPQDVLLAINGSPLKDSDELAAALAAITPGQRVKMALGRDSRVDEVEALASTRPPRAIARENDGATDAATMSAVPSTAHSAGVAAAPNFTAPPDATAIDAVPRPLAALQPAAVPLSPAVPRTVAVPPATPSQFQAAVPAAMPPSPPAAAMTQPTALGAAPAFAAAPPLTAPPSFAPAQTPPSALVPAPAAASAATPPPVAASAAALAPPATRSAPPATLESAPGRIALGVRTVPVDAATRARFQLDEQYGAMVVGVVHDLPAARAGVPPGSVIVAINHQPVRSPQDLTQLVTQGPVGRPVTLEYVLPGGEARKAEVVLQSLDRPLEQALVGGEPRPVASGSEPPSFAPAPNISRRVQPTVANRASEPEPLARFEELLRRINDRLDRLEQRFERLSGGR